MSIISDIRLILFPVQSISWFYFQFNPSVPISPDTHGFIGSPQLTDKIHCVAFVIDCSTVDVIPEKVLERIKSLQTRLNQKGMLW